MKSEDIFGQVVKASMKLPVVNVDRDSFLRKELSPYYDESVIEKIIEESPCKYVDKKLIDKLANGCIKYHTTLVTATSALAGIPGGWWAAGTIPADLAQFYGHAIALIQKLMYLYGYPDLSDSDGKIPDESLQIIILFLGVMFGNASAAKALKELFANFAEQCAKRIAKEKLSQLAIYKVAKEVCKWIGIKLTKESAGKYVGKVIPLIGAPISGTMTYFTFKPMSKKLKKHLDEQWKISESL